jgi:hypothetical protein
MPKIKCQHCGKEAQGRSDKKFCSVACKNNFHQKVRETTYSYVQVVDAILHKNHRILTTLFGDKRLKLKMSVAELERMGFSFIFYTRTFLNKENKLYHYVYNFSWMMFSKDEVHLYKRANHLDLHD